MKYTAMDSEHPDNYILEFYARTKSKQGLCAQVSINKNKGVLDINSVLTEQQIKELDKMVKKTSRRSVYQQLFDGIVMNGGAGECGFYPQENTLYFVSEGENPVDEFFGTC